MNLEIVRLTLGPLPNNVYLLGDRDSGDAVVIDPSYDSKKVLARAESLGWTLRQIWLTHAHFDHIAGAAELAAAFDPPLSIGLNVRELDWYHNEGGAGMFGLSIQQPPEPSILFEDGMQLSFAQGGETAAEVLLAPGHSLGHVMFYVPSLSALICGDVIFREGIGRMDLEGGNMAELVKSIRENVFTLPDETRLLPGHGPESTVGYEKEFNPFL
ncbi:MAG: MBL fold metallo-hydrolase [Anaerolineaceae bacterium]|nr:MBL fold metallo-hydrolase [Anaerolineaceae bacterium]